MRKRLFAILPCAALLVSAGVAQASVEISTAATKNMSCSAGVCSPNAKQAVLNVNDLTNLLASGDVKVATGSGAVTITVMSPFSWTSTHRLTLDAYYNVTFRAPVTVAGTGAVTITYSDGGSGGDLIFFPGAKLDFWDTSSRLIINGSRYMLAASLGDLISDFEQTGVLVALTRDYDASQDSYDRSPIKTLAGVFEGLGHTIKNLTINLTKRGNCVGLFLGSTYRSTIRDIRLLNANVSTTRNNKWIGTIEGCGGGEIVNSYSQGAVTGPVSSYIGGMAGTTNVIINSSADVNVSAISGFSDKHIPLAGGLVGDASAILNSHATGDVTGRGWVGGLAGGAYSVVNSYATGQVTTGDTDRTCAKLHFGRPRFVAAGGLVGILGSHTAASFATGKVTGGQNAIVGGLLGEINSGGTAKIDNSYSTGTVQGGPEACTGGLAGRAGAIQTSYSVGLVNGSAQGRTGGLLGADDSSGPKVQDYWDLDTSGIRDPSQGAGNIPNDPGITGLTDAQLKSGLPAGFDPKVWGQSPNINNGYPYLLANPPPQ